MSDPRKRKSILVPEDSDVKNALGSSDGFRQSLVDTLQESNTARAEMKSVLHELLRQQDTKEEIQEIIKRYDRDMVKEFWSRFGFAVWSATTFLVGVALTIVIQNFLKKP